MRLVFMLLKFVAAIVVACGLSTPRPMSLVECISRLDVRNANLTRVMECMARSSNRTAFMEDTMWKLDLLERRLDKLEVMRPAEVYVPSPYVNIDDVLNIEGSVAGFNWQSKQHVVQAIRRKLEQVHLINGEQSELFLWPFKRIRGTARKESQPLPTLTSSAVSKSPVKESRAIACLIQLAMKRHTKSKAG